MTTPSFVAAAVQAEPVWLNADASTDKAIEFIVSAVVSDAGASLAAFPGGWIAGYAAAWIWISSPLRGAQFIPRYYENPIVVGDSRFRRLQTGAV